jgi:DNA-binding MarR family transcriptional regulator
LGLDDVIDERARRTIMAILYMEDSGFRYLREKTRLTAGNLVAHLMMLEQAEYIQVKKGFMGKRPHPHIG